MKLQLLLICLFLLSISLGCSPATQREAEKAAQELRETGESLRKLGEEWAEVLSTQTGEWTRVWERLQSTVGASTNAAPIPYRELRTVLPEAIGDWQAGTPSGGHESAFGIGVSRAEVSLTRPDGATATIRIVDSGAMRPLSKLVDRAVDLVQFERESDTSFERSFQWHGHRGFERYHGEKREGSKRVWVGGIFELHVEGQGIDEADLDLLLNALDLERLLSMKVAANTPDPTP